MTALETYALQCGVKVGEPAEFPTNYFPSPEKYVTINVKSGQPAKDYDYFNLVAGFLLPVFKKHGITLVQLGLENENAIPGVVKLSLPIRQSSFLIENALLHIGPDTFLSHVAGHAKTPLLELFGSTSPLSARPHFLGKHAFLTGLREGELPSYQAEENPKVINRIKPEQVANIAFEMLGLVERVPLRTLFIGRDFEQQIISWIPNFELGPDYAEVPLVLRLDQPHNTEFAAKLLGFRQQGVVIITDKPLDEKIVQFKGKFAQVVALIPEDFKKEEILEMRYIPNTVFVYTGPKEKLNAARLELRSPHDFPPFGCREIPEVEGVTEQARISSRRPFLSFGNSYVSLYHAKNFIPGLEGVFVGNGIRDIDFWESKENYYIYT